MKVAARRRRVNQWFGVPKLPLHLRWCREWKKSELRNSRSERNPKLEIRRPDAPAPAVPCSDFGFRTSFGVRPSVFGFEPQTLPAKLEAVLLEFGFQAVMATNVFLMNAELQTAGKPDPKIPSARFRFVMRTEIAARPRRSACTPAVWAGRPAAPSGRDTSRPAGHR